LSRMPSKLFSREQRSRRTRLATSDDQPPPRGTTIVSDPVCQVGTHDDMAMSAIQTSLAVLQQGSSLAVKLPFIAPIAGLILQALTMRDEVKQYKEECEIVMHKLARIARIIVNVGELCEKHQLREEDLPASLRAILDSLQRTRELDRIGRVLKKCSKRKGIKRFLLRNDLLTKIKQCDVELSNVLHAFHAELSLDTRIALIALRREAVSDSGPIETIPTIRQMLKDAQIFLGTNSTVFRCIKLNAKVLANLGPDLLPKITRSRTRTTLLFFFPDSAGYKDPANLMTRPISTTITCPGLQNGGELQNTIFKRSENTLT